MDDRILKSAARGMSVRDRRYCIRYPFAADVELLDLESGTKAEGVTSDISMGGAFICTTRPFPSNARMRVTLTRKEQKVEALAVVRIVKPRIGLGVAVCAGQGQVLRPGASRPCIKGMFALFVEFALELETLIVGLGGANGFDGGGDPIVHVPLAEFPRGDCTVTGVVVWKTAVPPDAGVHVVRQVHAFLVAARFAGGAIEVRLGEEGKQMPVSAMTVDDDNLLAAIACHLIGRFLEQLQLEFHAVGDGSRFVFGFKNLSEVVLRKNNGVLLLRRLQ